MKSNSAITTLVNNNETALKLLSSWFKIDEWIHYITYRGKDGFKAHDHGDDNDDVDAKEATTHHSFFKWINVISLFIDMPTHPHTHGA